MAAMGNLPCRRSRRQALIDQGDEVIASSKQPNLYPVRCSPTKQGKRQPKVKYSDTAAPTTRSQSKQRVKPIHQEGQSGGENDENCSPDKSVSPKVLAAGPSEKEIAAAKAARIRLGYDKPDKSAVEQECQPKLPDGPEPQLSNAKIDYVPYAEVQPCVNPHETYKDAKLALLSSDWCQACNALCKLQQLVKHHADILRMDLPDLTPHFVKHITSLRSQLSKIAILCYGDLICAFGAEMLPLLNANGLDKPGESGLCQLLLKSVSKDKKFVLEAAQNVLQTCCQSLDSVELVNMLLPYLKHKNPRVRGAVAQCLCSVIKRIATSESPFKDCRLCMDGLLRGMVTLLSDKTPEARASARKILGALKIFVDEAEEVSVQGLFSPTDAMPSDCEKAQKEGFEACLPAVPPSPWDLFCAELLSVPELVVLRKHVC